jgi:hypothetical protein
MRIAFKEWAIITAALGCGEQIVIETRGSTPVLDDGCFQIKLAAFRDAVGMVHEGA